VQVAAMVVHIILDDGTSYTMQEDKADQHVEILLQLSFEKTPISTSVNINQSPKEERRKEERKGTPLTNSS